MGKGKNNGRFLQNGYWVVWKPDIKKTVREHVEIFEKYYKCCMLKWGQVHHIIPVNQGGTNDISNLQGMTSKNHTRYHNIKRRNKKLGIELIE